MNKNPLLSLRGWKGESNPEKKECYLHCAGGKIYLPKLNAQNVKWRGSRSYQSGSLNAKTTEGREVAWSPEVEYEQAELAHRETHPAVASSGPTEKTQAGTIPGKANGIPGGGCEGGRGEYSVAIISVNDLPTHDFPGVSTC